MYVVSGLSSSKVSVCSMLIKVFCEGRGGMIEQSLLKQISNRRPNRVQPHIWCSQISGISKAKMLCPLPYQKSYRTSIRRSTHFHPPFSGVGAFLESIFHTHLLLLIGHFGGLKVYLSSGRKEGWVCLFFASTVMVLINLCCKNPAHL